MQIARTAHTSRTRCRVTYRREVTAKNCTKSDTTISFRQTCTDSSTAIPSLYGKHPHTAVWHCHIFMANIQTQQYDTAIFFRQTSTHSSMTLPVISFTQTCTHSSMTLPSLYGKHAYTTVWLHVISFRTLGSLFRQACTQNSIVGQKAQFQIK